VTQQKIAAILSDARSAVLLYIAFTSLIFMALAAVMTVAKWCGIWRPNKAKLSSPVEQEVYRAELRRRPLQPVAA
jgi:hypothetical protein